MSVQLDDFYCQRKYIFTANKFRAKMKIIWHLIVSSKRTGEKSCKSPAKSYKIGPKSISHSSRDSKASKDIIKKPRHTFKKIEQLKGKDGKRPDLLI